MHLVNRVVLFCALLSGPASALLAQSATDASGHWEGAIHAPFGEVEIEIDLAKSANGEWLGTFSRPTQNLKGVPLSNIRVDGKSATFELKANQGGGPFDAKLSEDGKMSGLFTTLGTSVPFDLTRRGDARFEPAPKSAPISKELEGTWNGSLEANGTKLQLVLVTANLSGGTSTGTMTIADQGLEIPVAIRQDTSKVTLELKNVGSTYVGTLNPEGTRLDGTYTQGQLSLPLIFQRAGDIRQ